VMKNRKIAFIVCAVFICITIPALSFAGHGSHKHHKSWHHGGSHGHHNSWHHGGSHGGQNSWHHGGSHGGHNS
jgi:hypothetical protein